MKNALVHFIYGTLRSIKREIQLIAAIAMLHCFFSYLPELFVASLVTYQINSFHTHLTCELAVDKS